MLFYTFGYLNKSSPKKHLKIQVRDVISADGSGGGQGGSHGHYGGGAPRGAHREPHDDGDQQLGHEHAAAHHGHVRADTTLIATPTARIVPLMKKKN